MGHTVHRNGTGSRTWLGEAGNHLQKEERGENTSEVAVPFVLFCFLNHNQRNTFRNSFRNCRKPFSAKPHPKASKILCQDKVKNQTQPAEYGVHLLSNQTLLQALKPVFVILAGSFKVRKAFCKCNLVQCHGSHRRQGPTCGPFCAGEWKLRRP